jgi:hypothetical protein
METAKIEIIEKDQISMLEFNVNVTIFGMPDDPYVINKEALETIVTVPLVS